jgi:hypothetical protein
MRDLLLRVPRNWRWATAFLVLVGIAEAVLLAAGNVPWWGGLLSGFAAGYTGSKLGRAWTRMESQR